MREGTSEERSAAAELLRSVASRAELAILPELLTDPDPNARAWAIPLLRELLWESQIEPDDVDTLLRGLSEHRQDDVRDLVRELHAGLDEWKETSGIDRS